MTHDVRLAVPFATRLWLRPVALAAAVLLASCGGNGDNDNDTSEQAQYCSECMEHDVNPNDVNSAVKADQDKDEFHIAIPPTSDSTEAHKLFVFLPGTHGVPDMFKLIIELGAKRGYHTFGLTYPNDEAVGKLCEPGKEGTDTAAGVDDCFLSVRTEIITGAQVSSKVSVNEANSIRTRLAESLAYLDEKFPDEGWGQYLNGADVDWSKVVISGHSQGGGHAGLMAKLFPLSRACYFASPPDWNELSDQPAAWLTASANDQTAASKQFGFASLRDDSVPYDQLQVVWENMDLGAPSTTESVSSDGSFSTGGAKQTLKTDAEPQSTESTVDEPDIGNPLHGLVVRDIYTPLKSDGVTPAFESAWRYLCFQ